MHPLEKTQEISPAKPFEAIGGLEHPKVVIFGEIHDRASHRAVVREFLRRYRDPESSDGWALALEKTRDVADYLAALNQTGQLSTEFERQLLDSNPYIVDIDPPVWANRAYVELLKAAARCKVLVFPIDLAASRSKGNRDRAMAEALKLLAERCDRVVSLVGNDHASKSLNSATGLLQAERPDLGILSVVQIDMRVRQPDVLKEYGQLLAQIREQRLQEYFFAVLNPERFGIMADAVLYHPWRKDEIPNEADFILREI